MNRLFHAELELPIRGKSQRVTRRPNVASGETAVLFDEEGPGCIHHWWLTYGYKREGDARDPIHSNSQISTMPNGVSGLFTPHCKKYKKNRRTFSVLRFALLFY